jgi:hypothetical protein
MKTIYQLDREAMAAMLRWSKAQEAADLARAEYDKAMYEFNRRISEDSPTDEL